MPSLRKSRNEAPSSTSVSKDWMLVLLSSPKRAKEFSWQPSAANIAWKHGSSLAMWVADVRVCEPMPTIVMKDE